MTNAPHGRTNPAAGVIVARQATAPTQRPTNDGIPFLYQSIPVQTVRAVEAEISEFTAAKAALPVLARADPPLKPNQPNHRRPVPRATNLFKRRKEKKKKKRKKRKDCNHH